MYSDIVQRCFNTQKNSALKMQNVFSIISCNKDPLWACEFYFYPNLLYNP